MFAITPEHDYFYFFYAKNNFGLKVRIYVSFLMMFFVQVFLKLESERYGRRV